MNLKTNFSALLGLAMFSGLQAQDAPSPLDYRRSSMTMVLIEDDDLGKSKDLVIKSYNSYPFPDKYNKHEIADKKFDASAIKLTDAEFLAAGFFKDTFKTPMDFLKAAKYPLRPLRYLKADSSVAVQGPDKAELLQLKLQKYISQKNIARQMFDTWFNRKGDSLNIALLLERGKYSASAEKMDDAKQAGLEANLYEDYDLISNTYTVFQKLNFFPNEPVARLARDLAKAEARKKMAAMPPAMLQKSLDQLDTVYERTKEGYTVICTSFLYQLEWDADIAGKFKGYFLNEELKSKRGQIWDTTSIFKIKFVGKSTTSSIVTFKIGEKRTEEQIIDLQIKRVMDNSLARLQKNHVQFRPVAPVSSVGPVTARIGMKEGVEAKQTFEVLAIEFNEFGFPRYKSVGKVKVDSKQPIWDNRIGADQEPILDEAGNPVTGPAFTTFAGGKKVQPSINFLRLLK